MSKDKKVSFKNEAFYGEARKEEILRILGDNNIDIGDVIRLIPGFMLNKMMRNEEKEVNSLVTTFLKIVDEVSMMFGGDWFSNPGSADYQAEQIVHGEKDGFYFSEESGKWDFGIFHAYCGVPQKASIRNTALQAVYELTKEGVIGVGSDAKCEIDFISAVTGIKESDVLKRLLNEAEKIREEDSFSINSAIERKTMILVIDSYGCTQIEILAKIREQLQGVKTLKGSHKKRSYKSYEEKKRGLNADIKSDEFYVAVYIVDSIFRRVASSRHWKKTSEFISRHNEQFRGLYQGEDAIYKSKLKDAYRCGEEIITANTPTNAL